MDKNYIVEVEKVLKNIIDLSNSIKKIDLSDLDDIEKSKFNKISQFLKLLVIELRISKEEYRFNLLNFINAYVVPLKIDIDLFFKNPNIDFSIITLIERFDKAIYMYNVNKDDIKDINRTNRAINSESYYNKKIEELEKREAELKGALNITTNKSQEEINKTKLELEEANKQMLEYKKELEVKQKLEDAKKDWEDSINKTFEGLKKYLEPISNEQIRLKILFWVYLILVGLLVIAVIIIEWIAVSKVVSAEGFPDFKQYITIYMPLPIAGALLWGFIYQMNRAQRQLVVGAKSIHNVEYIQGLLLSINQLASTIDDGRSRINIAIDKLINNHLGQKGIDTEEGLIQEESKDSLPIDTVMKLMKEMKELSKKE